MLSPRTPLKSTQPPTRDETCFTLLAVDMSCSALYHIMSANKLHYKEQNKTPEASAMNGKMCSSSIFVFDLFLSWGFPPPFSTIMNYNDARLSETAVHHEHSTLKEGGDGRDQV